jgi:hypothetical protein
MPGRHYALPVVLLPLPRCGEFRAEHNVWRSVSVWGNGVRAASPCYPEAITVPILQRPTISRRSRSGRARISRLMLREAPFLGIFC